MHFYISSRLSNMDEVRYVAGRLKKNGWVHTCDWTGFDVSAENNPDRLQTISKREYEGIQAADVVIVITPQGRGTHIEMGMAIALGKRVYICHTDNSYFKCDDNTCAFYWLPQVKQLTGKTDTVIETILSENLNTG